ncbi:MAG: hypothetical protein K2P93_01435 [Alphaproteobacteria bacterium]|nr:hypothetical protein [Alphaproteobacteria bacterium]
MKKGVLVTLLLAMGILGGIGSQTNAGTLSCTVWNGPWPDRKGNVPNISSSTAPSLFNELCDTHISSCDGNCNGRLE